MLSLFSESFLILHWSSRHDGRSPFALQVFRLLCGKWSLWYPERFYKTAKYVRNTKSWLEIYCEQFNKFQWKSHEHSVLELICILHRLVGRLKFSMRDWSEVQIVGSRNMICHVLRDLFKRRNLKILHFTFKA